MIGTTVQEYEKLSKMIFTRGLVVLIPVCHLQDALDLTSKMPRYSDLFEHIHQAKLAMYTFRIRMRRRQFGFLELLLDSSLYCMFLTGRAIY